MIEFKDVTFSYVKNEVVINNISFKINPGETFAIVGPTGSGKTTITNLITRFYEHDKGKILIDGENINDLELTNIRNQVGIILQDVFLFADTIFNNIALYNDKISLGDIFAGAAPFALMMVAVLLLVIAFPILTTILL